MDEKVNPTSAGEEVVRCYKEVVIRGERCRCVLPDLHSFLCEMRPASPPPSAPQFDLGAAGSDLLGEEVGIAPASARPAEPRQLLAELLFDWNSYSQGYRPNYAAQADYLLRNFTGWAAPKSSTLGEEMSKKVVCKCGEELTPCTDKSPSSIPCKGWVHSANNSHVCPNAERGDIAEPASAPDAGQPQIRSVQPVNLHNRHAVGESVVELTNAELYPSAPASAARELIFSELPERPEMFESSPNANYAWFAGKYYTLNHPECVQKLCDDFAAEQTRQLREMYDGTDDELVRLERRAQAAEAERDKVKQELKREQTLAQATVAALSKELTAADDEVKTLQAELERLRKEAK